VAVVGLELVELAGAVDAERVVAELRLGRYDEAAARVANGAEVDERLRELVTRAASLDVADSAADRLLALAQEALEREDDDSARQLLELAALRSEGDASMEATVRGLFERLDGNGGQESDG
jgi:hypothetical protein